MLCIYHVLFLFCLLKSLTFSFSLPLKSLSSYKSKVQIDYGSFQYVCPMVTHFIIFLFLKVSLCVFSAHGSMLHKDIFMQLYTLNNFFTHTTSIISLLPLLYDILISRTVCIYIHVIYTVMILCIYIHFRAHDHKNHNYLSFGEDFNSPNVIIFS